MRKIAFFLILIILALPVLMVGCLRQQPPLITAFMLQSEIKPVLYEWVSAENIAEVARKAVVASEDQKFWEHTGFDFQAIEQAHRENQKRSRKRGASTISQQTAKNLFLWPGGGYLRKGIEAYLTVLIEWLWPKQRILEVYLNIVELAPGIYGVEAAAQKFFRKPASELTASEAAQLAAVLPNPKRLSAERPTPYVMARTAWILRQMGYGPRPVATPDPEPEDPEAIAPPENDPESAETAIDEPPLEGDEPREAIPEGVEPGSEGIDAEGANPQEIQPLDEPAEAPPTSQPRSGSGGGSVIDEEPDDEGKELEQSLIL